MNLVLDARWIFPRISGIGAYTRELLRALARLDSQNRYTVLFDRADLRDRTAREAGLSGVPNFDLRVVPWGVFSPKGQLGLPGWLRKEGADVFHSPNYMIPLAAFPRGGAGRPCAVVTIHDVIPLQFPGHAPRSLKSRFFFLYRWIMQEVARRAGYIITVSHASRADALRLLDIPDSRAGRVIAIPNGVAPFFCPDPARPPGPKREPGDRTGTRTCLYVGRADPYKNLDGLLRAFALARPRLPFPLTLTIAGPRDDRYPEAPALARALGVEADVEWTGYLSDEDLLRRYREADLLALPSRGEGFGLPVVEAMACGTPVLCSTIPALREIAGDDAVMADPDDIEGLARGMQNLLLDRELAERNIRAGRVRAAQFSWERTAARTLDVYRQAALLAHRS